MCPNYMMKWIKLYLEIEHPVYIDKLSKNVFFFLKKKMLSTHSDHSFWNERKHSNWITMLKDNSYVIYHLVWNLKKINEGRKLSLCKQNEKCRF